LLYAAPRLLFLPWFLFLLVALTCVAQITSVPLRSVRPFICGDIALSAEEGLEASDVDAVTECLARHVQQRIDELKQTGASATVASLSTGGKGEKEIDELKGER
jgi:hypothetical protein